MKSLKNGRKSILYTDMIMENNNYSINNNYNNSIMHLDEFNPHNETFDNEIDDINKYKNEYMFECIIYTNDSNDACLKNNEYLININHDMRAKIKKYDSRLLIDNIYKINTFYDYCSD